ncbi:hypothetical protein ACH50O_07810 [Methylomonas sp. 2BW1-5-20]|uniref:hypothetical protein n=1 Tax=Methylomonas sp. 2BW1-5-20 TaxID=3376686 RepID=UPI00404DD7B7
MHGNNHFSGQNQADSLLKLDNGNITLSPNEINAVAGGQFVPVGEAKYWLPVIVYDSWYGRDVVIG